MVTEFVNKTPCGWCITGKHGEECHGYVKSYDTIWVCGCTESGCGADSPRNRERLAKGGSVPAETQAGTVPSEGKESEPAKTTPSVEPEQDRSADPKPKPATRSKRTKKAG